MEEKGYKGLSEDKLFKMMSPGRKIIYGAARAALFVPRVLGKMTKNIIVNPILKLTTGQTYEQVRDAVVSVAMQVQEKEAEKMNAQIEEGIANLTNWRNDTDYYIGNLGRYKSYESIVNDFVKKQAKLRTSPKPLLVGKVILPVLRKFANTYKAEKAEEQKKERIKQEYREKVEALKEQETEIKALLMALKESKAKYQKVSQELAQFELDYAIILGKKVVNEAPVENISQQPVVNQEEASVATNDVEVSVEAPTFRAPTEADLNNGQPVVNQEEAPVATDDIEVSVEAPTFRAPTEADLNNEQPVVNQEEAPVATDDIEVSVEAPTFRAPTEADLNNEQPVVNQEEASVAIDDIEVPVRPMRKGSFGNPDYIYGLANSKQQELLSQMANLANMPVQAQTVSGNLEEYGLEGSGKKLS